MATQQLQPSKHPAANYDCDHAYPLLDIASQSGRCLQPGPENQPLPSRPRDDQHMPPHYVAAKSKATHSLMKMLLRVEILWVGQFSYYTWSLARLNYWDTDPIHYSEMRLWVTHGELISNAMLSSEVPFFLKCMPAV